MGRPALHVVQPGENTASPASIRVGLARDLRAFADVAEAASAWQIDGHDRDPICAAIIIVFGPDGEPTPYLGGIQGENWTDYGRWVELVQDATASLHALRRPVIRFGGTESKTTPDDWYAATRAEWLRRCDLRDRLAIEAAERKAATERERPWLCDCGFRAKSKGGLTNHLNRARVHRVSGSTGTVWV